MIQARRRRLAAVTDTPLWGVGVVGLGCGMLTGRKAGPVCVVGTWRESGVNGNCLYFLLSFAVNLKLLYKIKLNFKKKLESPFLLGLMSRLNGGHMRTAPRAESARSVR